MRALVVYESMYGNTHAVAVSVAAGLSTRHDVTLVPVTRATPELVAAADLLVVGGPTHLHRMSTAASRRWAADAARKQGGRLTMDPDADGPGEHGWLEGAGSLAASADRTLSRGFRHQAQRGPAVHRPRQPWHLQAPGGPWLPDGRRAGELPCQQEGHAA